MFKAIAIGFLELNLIKYQNIKTNLQLDFRVQVVLRKQPCIHEPQPQTSPFREIQGATNGAIESQDTCAC